MNQSTDDLIEDALQNYPLVEAPSNLSQKIMAQIGTRDIKSVRITVTRIPFRLTWMDYALGFFLTLLPMAGIAIWATLPRLALLRITYQWELLQTSGLLPALGAALAAGSVLFLLIFFFSVNLALRPEQSLQ